MGVAGLGTARASAPRPELQRRLDSLWVDWYTGQVVSRLRERQLEPILLKGPAIVRWLYAGEPDGRSYIDADLLVEPGMLPLAEGVLSELGFDVEELPWLDLEQPHAKSWRRPDGAVIDLHRVPLGCEHIDPGVVWETWRTGVEAIEVGQLDVLVPAPAVRLLALLLAVGVGHGQRGHELNDLERALAKLDFATWSETASLAGRLGLEREAGYGLTRVPRGEALSEQLGLPARPPLRLLLDTDPILRALGHLSRLPGTRAKLDYLARRLLPPPAYVSKQHPRAAGSAGGAALAYLVWVVGGVLGVPRAAAAWWRAVRRRRR
jgi:Uncharacterised nucleotidyltransferase